MANPCKENPSQMSLHVASPAVLACVHLFFLVRIRLFRNVTLCTSDLIAGRLPLGFPASLPAYLCLFSAQV